MTTQERAYINGFVKRTAEHGLDEREALALLKSSADAALNLHPAPITGGAISGGSTQSAPAPVPAAPLPAPAAPNAMPSRGQILRQSQPARVGGTSTASVRG